MILPDLMDGVFSVNHDEHDVAGVFSMTDRIREQGSRLLRSAEDFINSPGVNPAGSMSLPPLPWPGGAAPEKAQPFESYVDDLVSWLLPQSVNVKSPRCLANMSSISPAFLIPIGGLVHALNQNLVKSEASKGLSLIERQTMAILHRAIYGMPETFYAECAENHDTTLGIGSSGGTVANLTALWIARNAAMEPAHPKDIVSEQKTETDGGNDAGVIIVSELAHYSIDKAADLLGLTHGLIKIPVDANHRVDLAGMEDAVHECRRQGKRVIAVIGLAGSTECGSIDPLASIAAIARSAGAHFHVDAAWGAPLALSPLHRHKLAGIELADSVTVDAHKQFYSPVGSSFLLLRDPHRAQVIEKDARYLFHRGAEDLGRRSLEGSRSGSSLFLHAVLHVIGRDKLAELAAINCENARFMAELIGKSPEFELLCNPDTSIVVYRFVPEPWRPLEKRRSLSPGDESAINRFNVELQRRQSESGRSMVSRTTLFPGSSRRSAQPAKPVVALRAVLGNPLTSHGDLRFVMEDQLSIAAEMKNFGQ